MEETKQAYDEILEVLKKHKDLVVYDLRDMEAKAKYHLFGLELKEKYGLNLNPRDIYSLDYVRFGDHRSIGLWGEKYQRTVSWEDDGKQPEDEYLLALCFSTGGYIFGDEYHDEPFKEFWLELKSYGPKYCDTVNHNLYFSLDNASKVFNDFREIFDKHYKKYKEADKERKIKKMKQEIEKLESSK